ncbi:28S ribosomal protein S22, mitochondrial [Hylaeus anthracinus]|uniref:28S ribosomal protein S22, mitochondrial n=1 Tax=Hylaeus anthracinus TaxID=313031 RepID=UPI0023B9A687|nr:28S ribosomal protein S22, mitochondrial [Hylaeus anthracinus]
MMSSRMSLVLRHFYKRSIWNCRFCSSISKEAKSDDPAPLFFDSNVQKILRELMRVDLKKVIKLRKDGITLTQPEYRFMTDKELQEAYDYALPKVEKRLQIPPVVKAQPDTLKVLSVDVALEAHDKSKYVFTDISFGCTKKNRLIVIREPDGTLRHAMRDERNRIDQAYFPVEGREMDTPKMFEDPYFKDLLKREEFLFILDRACLQFEPDDPLYHSIVNKVYNCVNVQRKFNSLRSTRHFGSFVFHLAWTKNIDNLLVDVITHKRIDEAISLVRLYHIIHPEAKSAVEVEDKDGISLIKSYAKLDASQRRNIELAVVEYEAIEKEKQKLEENIKIAHGLDAKENEPQTEPN